MTTTNVCSRNEGKYLLVQLLDQDINAYHTSVYAVSGERCLQPPMLAAKITSVKMFSVKKYSV